MQKQVTVNIILDGRDLYEIFSELDIYEKAGFLACLAREHKDYTACFDVLLNEIKERLNEDFLSSTQENVYDMIAKAAEVLR